MQYSDFSSIEGLRQFYNDNCPKNVFHPVDMKIRVINVETIRPNLKQLLNDFDRDIFRLWFIIN